MTQLSIKTPCIYCGTDTESKKFIINPNANQELACCCANCYNSTKKFIDWDSKNRIKGYLLIAVCIIFNLVSMGLEWSFWWRYFALTGIGIIVYFFPGIFNKYSSYEKFGIIKTIRIIKYVGIGIAAASILFMIFG